MGHKWTDRQTHEFQEQDLYHTNIAGLLSLFVSIRSWIDHCCWILLVYSLYVDACSYDPQHFILHVHDPYMIGIFVCLFG